MTKNEIIKFDLENICFHEAGHLVALMKLGGHGFIRIDDDIDDGDLKNQSAFSGRVIICQMPETKESQRVVGLAGVLADMLNRDPELDEVDAECYLEDPNCLSPTDAELSEGYTQETVITAIELLRQNWAMVEHYAECEMGKLDEGRGDD